MCGSVRVPVFLRCGGRHARQGERPAWFVSPTAESGVDGDVSTTSTSPILTGIPQHGSGAGLAPCDTVIHACTSVGGTTLVLHLADEIDRFSATPLRAMLTSAAAQGYDDLVLDTSRVTFCDSGFLKILRWWPRRGRRLRLATTSPAVQRLLRATAPPRIGTTSRRTGTTSHDDGGKAGRRARKPGFEVMLPGGSRRAAPSRPAHHTAPASSSPAESR